MNEIEKLEKAIDGVKAKIQIQKAENQKLRNNLNEIEMNKANAMKEVNRLKEVNISLENNIKETKQQIQYLYLLVLLIFLLNYLTLII